MNPPGLLPAEPWQSIVVPGTLFLQLEQSRGQSRAALESADQQRDGVEQGDSSTECYISPGAAWECWGVEESIQLVEECCHLDGGQLGQHWLGLGMEQQLHCGLELGEHNQQMVLGLGLQPAHLV